MSIKMPVDIKKLGFGLMRLPTLAANDDGNVDVEQVKKMVDLFLAKGFTYFDTAWMYNHFASEKVAKVALVDRYPRDSFTLATKLHNGFFNSFEERDQIFYAQLENTGAGYFDYYLLHGIESGSYAHYLKFDCFNWLRDKKKQGLVKHIGFSYHDNAQLLDKILTENPDMEFVQLQINYLDWESHWIQSRACYEVACKHHVPVIVMEPVKGGTLASLPEEAEKLLKSREPKMSIPSWAIRFAASLPNVMMVLSGMSSLEQMEDNLSYMEDFRPLTEEEKSLVFRAGELVNAQIAIPCTGCAYCTAGCPRKIAIPQYFSLYNEDMREAESKGWTINFTHYEMLTHEFGAASTCIECGQCQTVCPQHLPIIENLKAVSRRYEHK